MSDDVGGFGTMPDTTGHHVGDTWSVTKNGFTTTYTIPEGNGTNTVDQTLTTSSGAQVGQMRIATDGHGATQKWGDYNGGSASYTSQDSPSGPTYNQLYNPGSSTSGAPNSVNAVLPGENHAIPLIQDGQRVGLLTTVDEGGGLSKNVYQDKDGNHYIYRSNPTEHGDMVTNQIGQLDKAGNGWLVGGYPQGGAPGYGLLWKVTATPDGNPILTNDEKTNSGQHFRVQNPDGTATDRYVGNDPYNSFTSVRDATGLTTKVGTDGSFTQWNANGEVLIHRDGTPKPEEPDNRSNWEKLWDGTGNILKGAWHGLEHVGTGVENLTGFNGGDAFDHAWDSVWGGIGNVGKEFWGDAKGFFPGLYHIGNDIYNMTGINGHDAITDSAFDLLAKTAGPGLSLALPVLDIVDAAQGKPVGWGTFGKDLLYGLNGVSEMVIGTDWSHFNEHPGATIGDALFGTALIMAPKGLRAIGVTDAVTSAAVASMDRIGLTDAMASAANATRDFLGPAGNRLPALLDAIGFKISGVGEHPPSELPTGHPEGEVPVEKNSPSGDDKHLGEPKETVPPAEFTEKERNWISRGETLLRNAGFDPDAIYGHLPENAYGRFRAAGVVAKTALSKSAVKAGMDVRAFRFAMEHGGEGNPTRFANAYEYYYDAYSAAMKSIDSSVPLPRGKNKYDVGAELLDDHAVSAALSRDVAEVQSIGKGAIALRPGMDPREVAAQLQQSDGLGFADPVSGAYHAPKHLDELPPAELEGKSAIQAYLDSADETIRNGSLVGQKAENGGRKFYFHRTVDVDGQPMTTEAIVFVSDEGVASIASYGTPKAIPVGTEYRFPDDDVDVDLTPGTVPATVAPNPAASAPSLIDGLAQSMQTEVNRLSGLAGPMLAMLNYPSLMNPNAQQPAAHPASRSLALDIRIPDKFSAGGQRDDMMRVFAYGASLLR